MENVPSELFLPEQVACGALLVRGICFSQHSLLGGGEVCFIGTAIRVLTFSAQLRVLKVSLVLKLNDFLCSDSYLQVVQISQVLQEPLQEFVWDILCQILKSKRQVSWTLSHTHYEG